MGIIKKSSTFSHHVYLFNQDIGKRIDELNKRRLQLKLYDNNSQKFVCFIHQDEKLLIVSEEGGTMSFYNSDMRYLQQFLDRNFGAYV